MKRGTSATKKTLRVGNIPIISGGKIPSFYCDVNNSGGEIITVAGSGAGAGFVQYWKKQYKYYNDNLFNLENVKRIPMGEEKIGQFIRGRALQKKDFTETGVGCIHYGQIYIYKQN